MNKRVFLLAMRSCGMVLFITAIAKLVSAGGHARILETTDPIFPVSFHVVFLLLGALELTVAAICFFGKQLALQAVLVASLATSFLIYRIGLILVDYHKPCSCLGNLTDALHISPQTADTVMKIILAYLLMSSYTTLFWLWRQRKAETPASIVVQ